MEGDLGAPAVRRGIDEWIDDLDLLDDRAGPSVRDDERQRIFMFRTNVDEMDVQPVDLGDELRQGLQLRLDLAPIVICGPIACEVLHRRELHALGLIRDGLLFGPVRGRDAATEVDEILFRNVDPEGADFGLFPNWTGHGSLPSVNRASMYTNPTYQVKQYMDRARAVSTLEHTLS